MKTVAGTVIGDVIQDPEGGTKSSQPSRQLMPPHLLDRAITVHEVPESSKMHAIIHREHLVRAFPGTPLDQTTQSLNR